jgi:hypothetical protein
MPRLLSDEAFGGHMKLILATENTPWRTARDALSVIKTELIAFMKSKEAGGPQAVNWHVTRTLSPDNLQRLRQAKPGAVWKNMPRGDETEMSSRRIRRIHQCIWADAVG